MIIIFFDKQNKDIFIIFILKYLANSVDTCKIYMI